MKPLVLSLDAIGASDLERVGGKAANLGELMRAGFPVPDGFVLTTEAYRQAAQAAAVDSSDPADAADRLRSAPVPESFAGQQDTYLNVSGEAALLDAIRRCWASLWNERAVAYRQANGIDSASVSLAVVVQRMGPATAAGGA